MMFLFSWFEFGTMRRHGFVVSHKASAGKHFRITSNMLRRTVAVMSTRSSGLLRCSPLLRDSSHHSAPHDTSASAGGASVTVGAPSSPVAKSALHDRSKFEYHSSAKGGEVGARKEAAFIG
jgi:hypothetical protein